ncbi:cysteine rich repeat-containing protein [Roseibium suaedae]|nr:cysteine rich repeat-containing protein [Roseibium suaedae]
MAQTVGFADAIRILSSSCGNDIGKYCKKENLGNNEITQCLQANESKLSQQCRADKDRVGVLLQERFAAQAAVGKTCDRDIQQFCKLVKPGNGYVLRCILKAKPSVSNACNQAIDLAGYR